MADPEWMSRVAHVLRGRSAMSRLPWWVRAGLLAVLAGLGWYQLLLPTPVTTFDGSPLMTLLTGRPHATPPDADAVLMGVVPLAVGAGLGWTAWRVRAGLLAGVWRALAGTVCSLLCLIWTAFLLPTMWPASIVLALGASVVVLAAGRAARADIDLGGAAAVLLVVAATGTSHFFVPLSGLSHGGRHALPLVFAGLVAGGAWLGLGRWPVRWHLPERLTRPFVTATVFGVVVAVAGHVEVNLDAYGCAPPSAAECPAEEPGFRWLERGGESVVYSLHLDPPRDTVVALARAKYCQGGTTVTAAFHPVEGGGPIASVALPGCDRAYYAPADGPNALVPVCASGLQRLDLERRTASTPPIDFEDDFETETAIRRPDGDWWLSGIDQTIIATYDGDSLRETGRRWLADGLHLANRLEPLDFIEPGLFLHVSSTAAQVLDGEFRVHARRETVGVTTFVAVDQERRRLYAPDTARRLLRVWTLPELDPVAEVPIDPGAYGAFHSSALGLFGVSHFHGDSVALYDADSLERRATLRVGPGPRGAVFDPARRRLYGASRCGVWSADLGAVLDGSGGS